jgi:uracil-DNA glycosylase family 4
MGLNLFGQPVKQGQVLGCTACPLDKVPGINKVKNLDRISHQKAFLWGMCPGEDENKDREEFVGRSGKLLWDTLKPCNIRRRDVAVQNVVRCRPTDERGENRDPTKRELLCCSIYNDEAIARNAQHAHVHLILGEVAATQLLGKFNRDHPIFWYPEWDAYVVLNYHPSYILRKGGAQAGSEYYTWRDRFRAVRAIMEHPGRFGYVKSREYKTVRTLKQFDAMEKDLRAEAKDKRRVSVDIEDGVVDGRKVMLLCGFGTGHYAFKGEYNDVDWKRWNGNCYSVVLDHPENGYERSHRDAMAARVRKLVEDGTIRKCLQNGPYDREAFLQRLNGTVLRGYDYDTQYGTFIRYSFLRSCSLENLTYRFFPEFCDYKDIVEDYKNFAEAPLDKLVIRNCGDCDITKRLEERFAPQVRLPLVQVYIHAAMTLDRMEHRGPVLDIKNWEKAKDTVPKMIAQLDRDLIRITRIPNFNAKSHEQVAHLVYDILGLENPDGTRSTNKEILEYLLAETGNVVLDKVMKRRVLGVVDSTFLKGYKSGADKHGGELRTIWWLTGARTGRLRSGKGDRAEAEGITNFQNMHGNPLLENLLVSDPNWRRALED